MNNTQAAEQIFLAGVRGVLPGKLITDIMKLDGSILSLGENRIDLQGIRNIFVIGAGKASAAMGHYVESILGDRVTGGHIVVKYGHSCKLKKIIVTEAGHPIPDNNGFSAAEAIIKIAAEATSEDLVICLISGGGSALLADLPEGILPEELYIVNNLLVRCGANIAEINCVRKHLSQIKGGQLARIVHPARLITLIISDVVGNPFDVIASGPTVPDTSTFVEAMRVIDDYNLVNDVTVGILNYLKEGVAGIHPETPKPGDQVFDGNLNILAGSNQKALKAAKSKAIELGYNTFIIDDAMEGDVENICESVINTSMAFSRKVEIQKPVCLLYGGESTLKVNGNGLGGRNQHLALLAALRLKDIPGITFLSAGTDGTDGPTDAAGAVVDSQTLVIGGSMNLEPVRYLSEFDSYNYFRKAGGLIKTGPTFTNVMDLIVTLVE